MENKQMENALKEFKEKYRDKSSRYDMSYKECLELERICHKKPIESTIMSFNYGFVKGVRFAKAMMKKGELI